MLLNLFSVNFLSCPNSNVSLQTRHNRKHKTQWKTQLDTIENSSVLLHFELSLLSWGHQPFLVLYSCSQGFLLYGKSALSSDWVVRCKKEKNWQNQVKYQLNTSVYNKRRGNSYLWLPLPGVMAVCIFEVLARPRVGVCVPLAFCLCHGDGLFPSYVSQGGFKAGLASYFVRIPSYFEVLWYPHLYFDHKSNI